MAANISAFPVLSDQIKARLRLTVMDGYDFSYERDDEEYPLSAQETGAGQLNHKLVDEEGIWNPDDYDICMKRDYSLQNYTCLFGKTGIVCSNAVLGLAVVWTSSDSKQRGAIEIGEILNGSAPLSFRLDYKFKTAQLRGMVEFSTILYIKRAGTPGFEERHLANMYGCILGELDRYQVQLDGNGSVFPIYEVNEPGQPLWYIKCEWDDPTYDQFAESLSVFINTAHKNYRFLDKTKKTFDSQLLSEVMASALCTIIMKLKSDNAYWDVTVTGHNLQQGSVSAAAYYFIETLGWDVSTPEALAISVRKYLDQKVE